MEKELKLYKYIDKTNYTSFPYSEDQIIVQDFKVDYKRMGNAPTITFSCKHKDCLDNYWDYNVYADFNNERFFIKNIPSSSYDNTDTRYKYEVELISERSILDNVYFFDVVDENEPNKPVNNSSTFAFFGDLNEFAERINRSLSYSKVNYSVVVDDDIESEAQLVSIQDTFITGALQRAYELYNIPYYFVGNVIHIGYTNSVLDKVFKYGKDESLLSIKRQNTNQRIVNRITGVGSQDNIPYYYPNYDEKGETSVLLNGSTSNVTISDYEKYKKVRLSDSFEYYYNKEYNTEYVDGKDYIDPSIYSEHLGDGKFFHKIRFYYQLVLETSDKITIEFYGGYLDTKQIYYELYSLDTNQHFGEYRQKDSFQLTSGRYNLIFNWEFENWLMPNEIKEKIDNLITEHLRVYAYSTTTAVSKWTKNGKIVSLDDYGISVNGTPSDGDIITIRQDSYIKPQTNLMPFIYRNTLGGERFYNAENNKYINNDGDYYIFSNEYEGKPKELIQNFEEIKPTIKGIVNSQQLPIDAFIEFAYDLEDNDEVDENNNYLHPYFFGKLRRFDGEFGFNLFDHAIDESEMVISMTSGNCGGCEFIIGVSENGQKNLVQVDENGNLLRDNNGNVRCGREGMPSEKPQEKQNDTINNEVWIALKKEDKSFGVIMPNASNNYKPNANDTFVILHIDLPKAYIVAAEKRLENELIKALHDNNYEKFNFSITFSRIYFAENPDVLSELSENSVISIEYDGKQYQLFVSSFAYSISNGDSLPLISLEISDKLLVNSNSIIKAINDVRNEVENQKPSISKWSDIQDKPNWITENKPTYSYGELIGTPSRSMSSSSGESYWELLEDENGNKYIYSELPVTSKDGFASYIDKGGLNLPSIYDGLPIDWSTIYWEEVTNADGTKTRVLKARGGSGEGGGSANLQIVTDLPKKPVPGTLYVLING